MTRRTPAAAPRVHRCRGCGLLLTAGRHCEPCETTDVHVITTLGTDHALPGHRIRADVPPFVVYEVVDR